MGTVDATMSTGGDCTMLGSKKLYCDVNYTDMTFKLHDYNVDFQCKEENTLFHCESSKFPLIAYLLRCDYVQRTPRVCFDTPFN